MAGVLCPVIIGTDEVGVARTEARQGNGAPTGRAGSGESAFESSSAIFLHHLLWVCDEESLGLTFDDGEVRGECVGRCGSHRCAEKGFKGHVRSFNKQFK